MEFQCRVIVQRRCTSCCSSVENIPLQAERHSAGRQKLFAFPPESAFTFRPECCSESQLFIRQLRLSRRLWSNVACLHPLLRTPRPLLLATGAKSHQQHEYRHSTQPHIRHCNHFAKCWPRNCIKSRTRSRAAMASLSVYGLRVCAKLLRQMSFMYSQWSAAFEYRSSCACRLGPDGNLRIVAI